MAKRDQGVSVRMPSGLYKAVQDLADERGWSLSYAILYLLTTHRRMR
jgi:hypothetical protein